MNFSTITKSTKENSMKTVYDNIAKVFPKGSISYTIPNSVSGKELKISPINNNQRCVFFCSVADEIPVPQLIASVANAAPQNTSAINPATMVQPVVQKPKPEPAAPQASIQTTQQPEPEPTTKPQAEVKPAPKTEPAKQEAPKKQVPTKEQTSAKEAALTTQDKKAADTSTTVTKKISPPGSSKKKKKKEAALERQTQLSQAKQADEAPQTNGTQPAEEATKIKIDRTVLVVEDNLRFQEVICKIFTAHKWETISTDSGLKAIDCLKDNRFSPDLIVTDIHMPAIDGCKFITLIRDIDAKIPIIAMTADTDSLLEAKVALLGVNAFVSKQSDPEVLLAWSENLVRSV